MGHKTCKLEIIIVYIVAVFFATFGYVVITKQQSKYVNIFSRMQRNENKFSNIKERILYFAESQNVTKTDFFAKLGLTTANFRGNAKSTPINSTSIENIITLYPQINLHWLITGKGEMLTINDNHARVTEPPVQYEKSDLVETQKELIAMQRKFIQELERKIELGNVKTA